jgi:hypothetical protein
MTNSTVQLKEYLKQYLQPFLGTYNIAGKSVIAIRDSNNSIPYQSKEGLEMVIAKCPAKINNGMNSISRSWDITLVQHKGTYTITEAVEKLALLDSHENSVFLPGFSLPTSDTKIPDQAVITLKESVIIWEYHVYG